jgi:hypothetical protein
VATSAAAATPVEVDNRFPNTPSSRGESLIFLSLRSHSDADHAPLAPQCAEVRCSHPYEAALIEGTAGDWECGGGHEGSPTQRGHDHGSTEGGDGHECSPARRGHDHGAATGGDGH